MQKNNYFRLGKLFSDKSGRAAPLSEAQLIKELVGKVSGIGEKTAERIVKHGSMKGKSFQNSGQFFNHLKGQSGKGFGHEYTDNVMKEHFEKMENIAGKEAHSQEAAAGAEEDAAEAEEKEAKEKSKSRTRKALGWMGGIAVDKYKNKKAGTIPVILVLILWFIDLGLPNGYRGIYITDATIMGILKFFYSLIPFIGIMVVLYLVFAKDRSERAILSYLGIIAFLSLAVTLSFRDPYPMIHIGFIMSFWFAFIRKMEAGASANIVLALFLFVDLYLVSILSIFGAAIPSWMISAPYLLIMTMIYVLGQTNNFLAGIAVLGIAGYYLFVPANAWAHEQAGDSGFSVVATMLTDPKQILVNSVNRVSMGWSQTNSNINTWLKGQIQYAITGKVEQNQYEQLGVYLEDIRPADSKFYEGGAGYEGDAVIVWGSVKARTLDDPINVKMGCFIKDGTKKLGATKVDPSKAFPVFTLEEKDFACTFDPNEKALAGKFKAGSKTVTTFAEFNFETLAFLKTYFMDRDRQRAMTREGIDPLDEFGIKDKKPQAIYTNGPVEIGMGTNNPLIGVSESYLAHPTLSLSVKNRQGWEGKITNFTEVVILFPKGTIKDKETECNLKFNSYGEGSCKTDSCQQVNNECVRVCNQYSDPNDKDSCNQFCKDKLNTCQEECDVLFESEGQSYDGFSLDKAELKKINEKISKDSSSTSDFEFFVCKLSPQPKEILENTPITTKSFRTKIRYVYVVEKPVTVRIEKDPLKVVDEKAALVKTSGGGVKTGVAVKTGPTQTFFTARILLDGRGASLGYLDWVDYYSEGKEVKGFRINRNYDGAASPIPSNFGPSTRTYITRTYIDDFGTLCYKKGEVKYTLKVEFKDGKTESFEATATCPP